ncbi:IPExxxVDY family protein [Epilithonimonas hispanica]|uniref:IPExxxVDY family protein n=1 Tax=Epilithonimonas hispanica TaxID=358687 RepID=A0A3D9D3J2_9FLAO|nr:IPExxxVDY family protein [Epilithonimonas hispanica]REC72569.1 IPExxxVDY family protein [Epilithonimonas hispanica]
MKIKKQYLKLEEDLSEINVGLIRLAKPIPEHELFFFINKINAFKFKRVDDILIKGEYFDYYFSRYQAYDQSSKNCFSFISNKSITSVEKKVQNQLFSDESNVKFLLNLQSDADYILTNSDMFAEFSLILLPENFVFQIQEYPLSSDEELYQLIQYYE